ncbi:Transcription factor E2F-like [Carpediemonas membranifera]|uniref:Transcription factor E2F-like n=1 Tax=Carpediemonas membranifera TaxID=201153 RepID=A0A8J6B0C6_9EUKA|nr:Transcription factor E2F-like [Carpediemonas membranifera]|eukprot:KAG9390272.1 Transcription factor E2F-like [Carpediemonas membranifera]
MSDLPPSSGRASAKQPRTRKREGLEDSTRKILELLMQNGEMTFKDIHDTLDLDYRRAYDILNVLLTTPLVQKQGKKRDNKLPYMFGDGKPVPVSVDVFSLLSDLEEQQRAIMILTMRIRKLQELKESGALVNKEAATAAIIAAESGQAEEIDEAWGLALKSDDAQS